MRIDAGLAEQRVHMFEHAFGHRMFEQVGLLVDDGPVHAENLDQKLFDQPVAADHAQRKALAPRGQADAMARRVEDQAGGGERLDHHRGRAGLDPHGGRELARRDRAHLTRRVLRQI